MIELFGCLFDVFYEGYNVIWLFDEGYWSWCKLYQFYYIFNYVVLFGGYYLQVVQDDIV